MLENVTLHHNNAKHHTVFLYNILLDESFMLEYVKTFYRMQMKITFWKYYYNIQEFILKKKKNEFVVYIEKSCS